MTHRTSAIVVLLAAAGASAQSFNVNLTNTAGPAATYAAAGLPGTWNNILAAQNVMYPLVGLGGAATGVTVRNIGGTALLASNHPGTSGGDEALLDTYRATFNQVETCLRFFNLQSGVYRITTYAWLPGDPAATSRVVCDESSDPIQFIGGPWPGTLSLGVTHAVHLAVPVNGEINVHSGLSVPTAPVAALNGIQLRLLTPWDGNVGIGNGGPVDLFTINGSTGGASHAVNLGVGAPLSISVAAAPGGPSPAQFIVWGVLGQPIPSSVFTLPFGIGDTCFPPCTLVPGTPGLFTLATTFGPDPCGALLPATSAPWSFLLWTGIPFPFSATFQGAIEQAPGSYAVFNAITLVVQ